MRQFCYIWDLQINQRPILEFSPGLSITLFRRFEWQVERREEAAILRENRKKLLGQESQRDWYRFGSSWDQATRYMRWIEAPASCHFDLLSTKIFFVAAYQLHTFLPLSSSQPLLKGCFRHEKALSNSIMECDTSRIMESPLPRKSQACPMTR